jgi:hypothetical protein
MKPSKFNTLKEATDAILFMDFKSVIAYRIEFKSDPTGDHWTVSRKILSNFPMGSAHWVVL